MNDNTAQIQSAFHLEQIAKEAAAISEARASRIKQWTSLGLSVPNDEVILVAARAGAAVDNCLKRSAEDSGERLQKILARCKEKAGAA